MNAVAGLSANLIILEVLSSKCMLQQCFNIIRHCCGCCDDFAPLMEAPCPLCRDPVRHHDAGAGRQGDHRVRENKVFLGAGVQAQGSFPLPDADGPVELLHVRTKVPFLCPMQPFLGGACSVNQISGKICVAEEVVATIDGHWVRKYICLVFSCVSLLYGLCHLALD